MTQHTRYMDSNQPICEDPARLDKFDTPVIVDFTAKLEMPCVDCSAALMAHNKKAYEDELAYDHNFRIHNEDPLAPARGVMYGVLLGSLAWIVIGLILAGFYLAFFRG